MTLLQSFLTVIAIAGWTAGARIACLVAPPLPQTTAAAAAGAFGHEPGRHGGRGADPHRHLQAVHVVFEYGASSLSTCVVIEHGPLPFPRAHHVFDALLYLTCFLSFVEVS
jgi:hypothetical protein